MNFLLQVHSYSQAVVTTTGETEWKQKRTRSRGNLFPHLYKQITNFSVPCIGWHVFTHAFVDWFFFSISQQLNEVTNLSFNEARNEKIIIIWKKSIEYIVKSFFSLYLTFSEQMKKVSIVKKIIINVKLIWNYISLPTYFIKILM